MDNFLIRGLIIGVVIGLAVAGVTKLAKKKSWSKTKEYAAIIVTIFVATFAVAVLFPTD